MSNRLTFGECEFLLMCLREIRDGANAVKHSNPSDIATAADFIGMHTKGDPGKVLISEWRELMNERIEKLDILIEKIEGLYGL